MEFIDSEHKDFFEKKLKELEKYGKTDVYYKSLVYTLSISETTRDHFDSIFNIRKGEININSISSAWQTGTSAKVTRMAFSLWNRCMYDSEEDRMNDKMSSYYNPSEVFCCSYAPYFWEAIKIRYPEYTKYNEKEKQFAMYMRVGNIEQVEDYVDEKIENTEDKKVVALYIRTNLTNGNEINSDIYSQRDKLEEFCKKNNIKNRIHYIDVRKSGLDKNRKAMNQMISDIKSKKVNGVVVADISKLYRNPLEFADLLMQDFMQDVEVTSLDDSVEDFKKLLKAIKEIEQNAQEEDEEETI